MPLCRGKSRQGDGVRGVDRGLEYRFFGGKIIIGPDYKSLAMSTALIVVPVVIYFIFVAPYMGRHMSWAYPAVSAVLVAFVLLMLGLTALGDPGFIPRSPPNSDVEFGLCPSTRDYPVNGYTVTTKFCATCCHYRPPRCSHCAVCDNCVDRFDHHCPWVGTCVGRRNYRTFYAFIVSTTALCCWVIATCILQLRDAANERDGNWGSAFGAYPASIVLIIYCFIVVWFVGGLSCLHTWLVLKNMTTYEHFRHRYAGTGNPYSRGLWKNCGEVLCSTTPPRWGPLYAKQRAEDDAAAAAAAAAAGPAPGPNFDGSVPPSMAGDSPRSPTFAVELEEAESADAGHFAGVNGSSNGGGGGGGNGTSPNPGDIELGAVAPGAIEQQPEPATPSKAGPEPDLAALEALQSPRVGGR